MRTTLTLDDDVAVQIEHLRKRRGESLKDVVNDALRRGLVQMSKAEAAARAPFRTGSFDAGAVRGPGIDNVAEVLAFAEGEPFL
jgi:hypothetical protein